MSNVSWKGRRRRSGRRYPENWSQAIPFVLRRVGRDYVGRLVPLSVQFALGYRLHPREFAESFVLVKPIVTSCPPSIVSLMRRNMEKSVLPRERILRVRSHCLLLVLFYACALKKLQGLNSFLWWTICMIIINSGLIRNFVEIKLVFIYCVIVKQGENPRKRYKIIQCMRMYIIYIFRHIKLRNKKKGNIFVNIFIFFIFWDE